MEPQKNLNSENSLKNKAGKRKKKKKRTKLELSQFQTSSYTTKLQ